jgi:hypothetical protein
MLEQKKKESKRPIRPLLFAKGKKKKNCFKKVIIKEKKKDKNIIRGSVSFQ